MTVFYPSFYQDFHCLAGACPDSCCRQGWVIPVDAAHAAQYAALPGELGRTVRNALCRDGADTVLRMESGVCALLREDGLCPIEAECGEKALCDVCRTHPRFIEQYGGRKEIHLSLSCPEAARLALSQIEPIAFLTGQNDEPVTEPNTIDPDEYFALLEARRFALQLAQDRRRPLSDRIALLLRYSARLQNLLDCKEYELCKSLSAQFRRPTVQNRAIVSSLRLRLRGASYFPDVSLMRSMEHLTKDFPALLSKTVFTVRESQPFWDAHETELENLLALWLAHYIPKAVCDGSAHTKILFSVFLTLASIRLCVCAGGSLAERAGLLAKELEHSESNVSALYEAFSRPGWADHFLAQLPAPRKGNADHAV